MEQTKKTAITEGVIWKQLLIFFFPILFGTFFQQLYNTADAVIVGRFIGKEALSAVGGTTSTLINLLIGFFVGCSSGATVIISQYYGAQNNENVKRSVHTAMSFALFGGVVITILGIAIAPWALTVMNTPADIFDNALQYIRIYFAGTIANLVYNMGAGILRAIGDSKRPLYFLIAACFFNIGADILFVVVLSLGILGVALATILSQLLSACLVCACLMRTKDSYRLLPKELRFHKDILLRIIRIGLPAGFQSSMYSISNIIIQSNINTFGTDTVAAWTAYSKIDSLFWMIVGAFGVSITTFVGQNFGAGKYDRVKKGTLVCIGMSMGTAIALSTILYTVGQYLYLLFTTDELVLEIGVRVLHFLVPCYVTYICIEILSGALRGMGKSLIPLLLTCFGICVFRIVWISITVPLRPEITTVIVSYPLSWTITSILFIIYYCYTISKKRFHL